jgi:transcriptional regulator with XRE-family HTH domain
MVWAGKIGAFRKRQALTQAELAGAVGTDERVVRRWEQGTARPMSESVVNLRQLMTTHGARDIADKQPLQCDAEACVFALPMAPGAALALNEAGREVSQSCSGLCHAVHDQMTQLFGQYAKEEDVHRLKAVFTLPHTESKSRIAADYHFIRTLSAPMLIAEWRKLLPSEGEDVIECLEIIRAPQPEASQLTISTGSKEPDSWSPSQEIER